MRTIRVTNPKNPDEWVEFGENEPVKVLPNDWHAQRDTRRMFVAGFNFDGGESDTGKIVLSESSHTHHGLWTFVWEHGKQIVIPEFKPVTDDEVARLFGLKP